MKTRTTEQQALYDAPTTAFCVCMRIANRTGDTVFGLTTLDEPVTFDGLTYTPGLDVAALESTNTLGVGNTNLTLVQPTNEMESMLEAGYWDNSSFVMFDYAYLEGVKCDTLKLGSSGEVQISQGKYVIEFRGLTQALQQTVGIVTSKTCRANFADYPRQALASKCLLNAAAWTVTGSVTSVSSRQVFGDSTRTEADDWFAEGFLKFITGDNAGFEFKVKAFDSGVFTFVLPFPFTVQVGDEYSVIAGCRKRRSEDCKLKFNNVPNFQGEPNLPGVDALTKVPGVGT